MPKEVMVTLLLIAVLVLGAVIWGAATREKGDDWPFPYSDPITEPTPEITHDIEWVAAVDYREGFHGVYLETALNFSGLLGLHFTYLPIRYKLKTC